MSVFIVLQSKAQLSFGKEFDHLIERAYDCFEQDLYYESGILYDSALVIKKGIYPLSSYHISATKSWARANDKNRAFYHLFLAIEKGWVTINNINDSEDLVSLKIDPRWIVAINEIREKNAKYKEIVNKLEVIRSQDQFLRQLISCAKENSNIDSNEMYLIYETMGKYDSLNLILVEKIVSDYGWLAVNKIGDRANQTLWAVIQHCSKEDIQQKYLPIIKNSVLKGETPASQYAFLVDRIAVNSGELQVFGTQICTDTTTKEKSVCPLQNPNQVDERRKEIGFEPLNEYLNFFDVKYSY